ncbi:MAG TPA: uracil-DNA glycosylase [Pyrinomonadaceae bacterium]|nr:uracil-DNA glycosylase [Pyrinomonadaceae bacterium]
MGNRDGIEDKFSSLAKDASEYLIYLGELGVGGVEDSSHSLKPVGSESEKQLTQDAVSPAQNAALQRNAQASTQTDLPPKRAASQATADRGAANIQTEQREMAKRTTKKYPDPQPPPPQETLFGEITPADEESLPQRNETLEDIRNDIGVCMRCPLCCQGRTNIVNSEGNPKARLMFVGEAPGADEDASGRPFVGRAGQLLNKIIEAIGIKREDVMIGNVNRCRPPQNRQPTTEEAKTCKPFLLREIAVVRPDVIVVLGNTAMKNLLDTKEGITRLRGQFQDYKGIKVMPTFHPAYLLRDPSKKREAWEDMKKVRDYLNQKSGVRSQESE